tara:strand:+ start:384 stop:1667 length:1284 start_codon:yes stop_codon:yes gene_type:complete
LKIFFIVLIFIFKNSFALEFDKLQTNSGISFWFVKDSSIPIVSVSFSFRGGSFMESQDKQGLSNLMTSLLDEGTRDLSAREFKKAMKINGMKLSVSSQKDKIDGSFQVISSQISEGFNLFYESLNHPRFEDKEINKVKNQIISSLKIDQSDIPTIASNLFNENFFGDHSFARNTKGTIESIKKINRNDLVNFHKKAFQKSNLIIGVSGNIGKEEIKKKIDLVFSDMENTYEIPKIKRFTSLAQGDKIHKISTPQTSVFFGHPGFERNNDNFFELRIANYILGGGGFQSRLYKNIREKRGLVYSIYTYLLSYETDGILVGGFQTRNESVNKTIKAVKREFDSMRKKGISKEEFENAKDYFNGSFTRNFTSTISIAKLLQVVQYFKLGEDYFKKREEIINNLELEKVNKIVSDIFKGNKLFFMIVGEPE